MTYLSERTDHAERGDLSPCPEQHPAAGPPVIQFVPIEGERLEHLATERRGPLRWTASAVLSVQALVRKGPSAPAPPLPEVSDEGMFGAPEERGREIGAARRPGDRRRRPAEIAVARRRRARRARRARHQPRAAATVSTAPAASSAPPTRTVPEPMPGSGWSWNADDEQSWEAWEANVTAGDTDRRLASLDTDLERPLPAPVRLAHLVGGRRLSRRSGRRGPAADDA